MSATFARATPAAASTAAAAAAHFAPFAGVSGRWPALGCLFGAVFFRGAFALVIVALALGGVTRADRERSGLIVPDVWFLIVPR